MKIRKFNELKQYSAEDISKLSVDNRRSYQRIIDHLKSDWNFPEDVITNVVVAMGGSYDSSDEYLSDMDAFEYKDPADYWIEWCHHHRIDHESNNNPFL